MLRFVTRTLSAPGRSGRIGKRFEQHFEQIVVRQYLQFQGLIGQLHGDCLQFFQKRGALLQGMFPWPAVFQNLYCGPEE